MGKKGGKKKAEAVDEGGQDIEGLIANYKKACKAYGVPAEDEIIRMLTDEENPVGTALNVTANLGPAGTRALATGLLGHGKDMKGGAFKKFNCLRFWRCNARLVWCVWCGCLRWVLVRGAYHCFSSPAGRSSCLF